MTSKLKCPICGGDIQYNDGYSTYDCKNNPANHNASEEIWQALIRRTNQLNIAITDIHHAYKSLMGGCAEWRLYLEQTLKQIQDLDNDK